MTDTYWVQWTFDSKVEFFIKLFIGKLTLKLLTHLEKASICVTDLQWVDMRSFGIHWVIWYPSASNSGCPLIISPKKMNAQQGHLKFWSCEAGSFEAEKWAEAQHLSWSRSAPLEILVFSSPTNYMFTIFGVFFIILRLKWVDKFLRVDWSTSSDPSSLSFRTHTFELHSFEADNFKTHKWVIRFLQVEWSRSLDPRSLLEAHNFPYLTALELRLSKLTHGLLDSNLPDLLCSSSGQECSLWRRIFVPQTYFDGEARCCACLNKTHTKWCRGVQDEPLSQRVVATCGLQWRETKARSTSKQQEQRMGRSVTP